MPDAAPHYQWDHIHLRSPDPEATAAWFERMLGAQVIRSIVEASRGSI
jgi:lactoylglutathione lyase